MRPSIALVAFAAGALAVPFNRRDVVVTDLDVVYATQVVTVTAGAQPQHTPAAAPPHYGHHNTWQPPQVQTVTYEAPQPSSPAPQQPSSAPPPPPTYQAPSSSSSQEQPQAPSTPSSGGAGPAPTDYQSTVIYHHNIHRQNHSAPDLEWDDGLYSSAQQIASSCVYAHNVDVQGGGYGQNIAAGVDPANISAVITDLFYNGEEPLFAAQYGLANPDMSDFEQWGHFTQIVWKDTTHVACATQYCPNGLANTGGDVSPYFTVCNYKGPGNYAGEYAANVMRPIGDAIASWSAGLNL